MSGRPTFFAWTKSGNYPAGANPWNGQPLGVQPAGTYFTPNTKPAAEDFNWLFGTLTDQTQALVDWTGCDAALNWRVPQGGASASGISNAGFALDTTNCVAYDALNQRWLIAGRDLTTGGKDNIAVIYCDDGFSTFNLAYPLIQYTAIDTVDKQKPLALLPSPVTSDLCLIVAADHSAGGIHDIQKNSAGTWTSVLTLASDNTMTAELTWNGSVYIALIGAATPKIYSSPTGTTWTNRTIPAGVTSAPVWAMAQNGVRTFAFPQVASLTKFAYSDDGITWSEGTIGLASGEITKAAAVVQTLAGAAIIVATKLSGLSNIWRSTDNGATWTQIKTGLNLNTAQGTGAASTVTNMAAIGSLLVAVGEGGRLRVGYSVDAGVTWRATQTGITTNRGTSDKGYTVPRIAASPTSFHWLNSLWCSMSYEQGLSATL